MKSRYFFFLSCNVFSAFLQHINTHWNCFTQYSLDEKLFDEDNNTFSSDKHLKIHWNFSHLASLALLDNKNLQCNLRLTNIRIRSSVYLLYLFPSWAHNENLKTIFIFAPSSRRRIPIKFKIYVCCWISRRNKIN